MLSHWPRLQNKYRDSSKKVSSLFQVVVHMNHRPGEFLHLMLLLDHSATQASVLGAGRLHLDKGKYYFTSYQLFRTEQKFQVQPVTSDAHHLTL